MDESAVEDQDVEPAIVIEVVDACTPARVLRRCLRNSGCWTDILESVLPRVSHQAVVFGIGHPEIHAAVCVDVGKNRTHGRSALAVLAVGDSQISGNLLERSIVLVMKKEVLGLI